jgi:hypothetical protein
MTTTKETAVHKTTQDFYDMLPLDLDKLKKEMSQKH